MEGCTIKVLQRFTIKVNHLEERILRCAYNKLDRIGARIPVLGCYRDALRCLFQYRQHALRALRLGEGYIRNTTYSFVQRIDIMQCIGMEARQGFTVQQDRLQRRIVGLIDTEMNDIRTT